MEKVELSWAELKERAAETDRRIEELHRSIAETNRAAAETTEGLREAVKGLAETRRLVENSEKRLAKSEREYTGLNKRVEGIAKSNGRFAEDYFLNTLEDSGLKFAGISFDKMRHHVKMYRDLPDGTELKGEFDIVLIGAEAVAIIELTYKAEFGDIKEIVDKKVKSFRTFFPEHAAKRLYLGVGSLSFDEQTLDRARKSGVALLKQVGEAVAYRSKWAARAY